MSKLSRLKQWLLERRYFSTSWFDKGPQAKPKEEEALTQLPNDVSDSLLAAINDLPTPACEQDAVLEAVNEAIARWQKNPQRSTASVVVLAHPVSSVARILSDCLTDPASDSLDNSLQSKLGNTSLRVKLLDWVERPTDVQEIKEKIREKLGWGEDDFPAEGGSGYETRAEKDADNRQSAQEGSEATTASDNKSLTLAVIPNLDWCFLRSADGLDGIDYLQELLLDDHHQFWIIGSGKVGWEYLHSTLKLGAYCGEAVTMPGLSGEQLQSWLQPVVEQFDIRFRNRAFHQRLQDSKELFPQDVSLEGLDELRTKVSKEVSSTVQSSLRSIKEEIQGENEQTDKDESPQRNYFDRLADISEGVSIVALQLFIQSLRYRKVDAAELEAKSREKSIRTEKENKQQANLDSESSELRDHQESKRQESKNQESESQESKNQESKSQESESQESKNQESESQESEKQESERQNSEDQNSENQESKPQLIATFPKSPTLPDLDQGELYLLYSLMLHGDLTVRALARSLGDPPQVVNNQLQVLRSGQVVEQKDGIVKINPVHYPNLRKELLRNNFIIKVD